MTFVSEDLKTILSNYVYSMFSHGTVTGTRVKWETFVGDTSLATGVIVELTGSGETMIYITSGTFNPTEGITCAGGATFTLTSFDNSVPSIRLIHESHPSTHSSDGEIVIGDETLVNIDDMASRKEKTFRILVNLRYDGQTDPTLLKRLIKQIEFSFDAENRLAKASRILSNKDYWWKHNYFWNGIVRLGSVDILVDVKQRWIAR